MSRAFQLSLIVVAFGSTWNLAAFAQGSTGRSHPEVVQALTCRDLTLDALTGGGLFGRGAIVLGLPSEDWTKQDLRQLKEKFDDCDDRLHPASSSASSLRPSRDRPVDIDAGRNSSLRHTADDVLESQMYHAVDPEGEAQKTAERQRMDKTAQERIKMETAARQAEDQRLDAEQQQRTATRAAQTRAADIEAQAQDLRNQQTAADQAVRNQKQQIAAQAAADQAAAERMAKAKRDQIAAEVAAEEAAQKMPKPLTVDCAQASTLAQVQAVLAKRTKMEVFKVYNSEPNPTFTAYLAAPALERVRMSRQIFSVPQCYAMAMTSSGEMPLAFRMFKADGDQFIEITDRAE